MVVKHFEATIREELINKLKHFQKALTQAEEIISKLEEENAKLKEMIPSSCQ
jgi:exonuclease VII small subunit